MAVAMANDTAPDRRRLGLRRDVLIGFALVLAGVLVRLWVLPSTGYRDDLDQFVEWIRFIANHGLGHAYDAKLSFGPVMAFLWWLHGLVTPAFATAPDALDPGLRLQMKLPATLADFGLAAAVWHAVRSKPLGAQPGWALVAAGIILLHPGIWFLSGWWGQYESIFALEVVIGFVFATSGRNGLAVVALTAALLTKPQVAPLLVPFGAYLLARIGWRSPAAIVRLALLAGVAAATAAVLWAPFVAAGGPAGYLQNLASYQGDTYSVLSLRAWNLWWAIQELLAPGAVVGDGQAFLGPLTFRALGYGLTGTLLLVIGIAVYRRPTAAQLALGVAAAAMVAYAFLTTMHERYAFAAVPFLALLVADRRLRWIALALGLAFVANLIAVASATYLETPLVVDGLTGFAGSAAMVSLALVLLWELVRRSVSGAGTPPGTSAGSAGATSGA